MISAVNATGGSSVLALDLAKAYSDGGYAIALDRDFKTPGDSDSQPNVSILRIFEDGKELGPAHSLHRNIRNTGKGMFSHWGNTLYFSTSDNSNPQTNGRKYTYSIGNTVAALPMPSEGADSPVSNSTIIGYASVDGKTTGGKGGRTVTVSSFSDLKKAVADYNPLIIQVSGNIKGTGYINVRSNKTITGLRGSSLEGVSLLIYGESNVIIRNMTIRKVVGYSNIIIKEKAHHIWVDHCDLSSDRNHGWEYYDGLLDVGKKADYVTISWNKFHDNHVACLIGWNSADYDNLRVTMYNNHFYNISERSPDMRYGHVHYFNNYNENNNGYSISALEKGTVRTDNNYFSNCNKPITTTYNGYTAGYISGAATNVYVNSGKNNLTTNESKWLPPYEYKSALIPASSVPAVVSKGAGATL
ncbi:polysaccharide lyase family 1 protein [Arcticibacter sp.]|uniref:pectate lyase family protein n=1 Tax=Arcticibacter sp. TaxID=1872630 RepID=UPI003890883E